jgi:hypothetical protein
VPLNKQDFCIKEKSAKKLLNYTQIEQNLGKVSKEQWNYMQIEQKNFLSKRGESNVILWKFQ